MTVVLWIGFISVIVGFVIIKVADEKNTSKGLGVLFFGIALCAIGLIFDDDEDKDNYTSGSNSGYNVSFEGSETSRKKGSKCHYRDYGEGNYSECSDKSNGCSGFSPKNRDPRACDNCPHRVDEHY